MLGYISWHQLDVYSYNSCLFIFLHVVIQLSFSYLFIMLFSYLLFAVYLVIILCTFVYIHEYLLLYAHSLSHFLITLDLYVKILDAFLYCSGVWWDRTLHEELELLPIWFRFLSFLPFCYFLILDISDSVVIPVLYLYDIMCGCLYVLLQ